MRLQALALMAGLLLAAPAVAQQAGPEVDILPDAVVVFNDGGGPAWWKVTKGDSTVFILGLPPTKTLPGLKWDRTTLKRRVKGAKMMLAPYTEGSGFGEGQKPLLLDDDLARRVRAALVRMGERIRPDAPVTVWHAQHVRGLYSTSNNLTRRVHDEIYAEARRARVPIVTPPVYYHDWIAEDLRPDDPEVRACLEHILKESELPMSRVRTSSEYWAVGEVGKAIAAVPPPNNTICDKFWPGHVERTIGFQTNAIAQALDKPGKVVAVVYLYQLLSRNGILERLRARGYTVSDPAKPLTE